jgi:hypothetical protein
MAPVVDPDCPASPSTGAAGIYGTSPFEFQNDYLPSVYSRVSAGDSSSTRLKSESTLDEDATVTTPNHLPASAASQQIIGALHRDNCVVIDNLVLAEFMDALEEYLHPFVGASPVGV